jgi:lipopolysaccharide export system protein LptA
MALICGASPGLWAATTSKPLPVKGFILAEPYPPPHEEQTHARIEGAKALVFPSGSALISEGVTVHTFTETNTPQYEIRARECFYNVTNHSVNSAGPIQMQTADGKFFIEGVGFVWVETNSSLVISNKVHTLLQSGALQPGETNRANAPSEFTVVDSDKFFFDGPSRTGIWRDKVVVTGSNLVVRSEILTAEVGERQVRALVADRNVSLKYNEILAQGGRLTYAPGTGLINISDHATWQAGQTEADRREGGGDELVIDRTNQIFQVNRHAWLKLPGQTLGDSGLLSAASTSTKKPPGSPNAFVNIVSDSYEIRTNWAVFRDGVRLEQRDSDTVRGWLTSGLLTVTFQGTNNLQTLAADRDVIIQDSERRLTGGHALYTHTNGILEMTQNPRWRLKTRNGAGDLIRVDTQRNEMFVQGNASMTLPAGDMAGQLTLVPTTTRTNQPPRIGTNELAQIYSEEYTLGTNRSVFRGGVYATHPEMNWSCERFTVDLSTAGMTNLIAEQEVVFNLLSQTNEIHGKADKSVYSSGLVKSGTNGVTAINELRLTGTPAILASTNGTLFQNPLIIWDRLNDKLEGPGNEYKITGYAKAALTNIFVLPNKKRRK